MVQQTGRQEIKESAYTYDQKFKQLFQNKKFLAPILKNIVKEYKELPLHVITGCRLPDTEDTLIVDLYFDLEMQREETVCRISSSSWKRLNLKDIAIKY